MTEKRAEAELHARFRRWLIEKVKRSRWVTYPTDSLEAVALRIGVQPEVLVQAQHELTEERRSEGKLPIAIGSGHVVQDKRKQIDLDVPKAVFDDWTQYCQTRDLPSSVVLRSLIHTLLSGPENPTWTGRGWWYRGKMHRLTNYATTGEKGWWPYNAKTDVTPGAARALNIRAQSVGCPYTALVRGTMIDLLEGRTKRLNIITSASSMWEDESRYWTGKERS